MFHRYLCKEKYQNLPPNQKTKVQKPCLYYYTGGEVEPSTSLRTLDFESSAICIPAASKNSNWGIVRTNA